MAPQLNAPVPKQWSRFALANIICAIGLAAFARTEAALKVMNTAGEAQRLVIENAMLRDQLALITQILDIYKRRFIKLDPKKRPHVEPSDRLLILNIRALMGWTAEQTAQQFLLCANTVRNWFGKSFEPSSIVTTNQPINKLSDRVRLVVHTLKAICPSMGRRRIAAFLLAAGMTIAASTVGRVLKEPTPLPPIEPDDGTPDDSVVDTDDAPAPRAVYAKHPHHVWHTDITNVPIEGLWTPWFPFRKSMAWPNTWHVVAINDQFSRAILAIRAFAHTPKTSDIIALAELAAARVGRLPKYCITDAGMQFRDIFNNWCRAHAIGHRRGAVGKHGSIAVLERFWRSLKHETFMTVEAPREADRMNALLESYRQWFNQVRPHTGIGGACPAEFLNHRKAYIPVVTPLGAPPMPDRRHELPANCNARASPSPIDTRRDDVELIVTYIDGQRHLPVVSLRTAV